MASVNYLDGRIDVYAYLVVRVWGVVLIDTGVGEGHSYIEKKFQPQWHDMAAQLARFGVAPGDVTAVVNSHLHFDHCGNNHLFPQAEMYVQAVELEAAQAPSYTVTEWFEPRAFTVVQGDMEIAPGVHLLATPGHTPGHQSVLIEGSDGPDLVVAQAAYTAQEYRQGGDPDNQAHEGLSDEYRESIARLKSLNARRLYFSHDSEVR